MTIPDLPVIRIKWRSLLYNPYRKGLFPGLLDLDHSNTLVRTFYSRCKGMKKTDSEINLEVEYDRDYLDSYLINKILVPLQVGNSANDFNNLMKAISRAYKQLRQEHEIK